MKEFVISEAKAETAVLVGITTREQDEAKTKEYLDELEKTWMAKMNDDCIFISAKKKVNVDLLRERLYAKVRQLHVQKYPYNDFLYEKYEE